VIPVIQNQSHVRQCIDALGESGRVVLLSGAGLSTSAGIPDFRGPNGIYRRKMNVDPEQIFDIDFFHRRPEFFYEFHREFLRILDQVEPTFSHRFFTHLEREGKLTGIVTQNIDSLHQRAGTRNVLEIHGGIWSSSCTSCRRSYDYDTSKRKMLEETVPHCACGGVIKPDIVFFGENVKHLERCQRIVHDADLLFVVGSSLAVTPAARLPAMCPGKIIVVNRGEFCHSYLSRDRILVHAEEDIDEFFRAVGSEIFPGLS
jgi:NAD-dependent deacetylase